MDVAALLLALSAALVGERAGYLLHMPHLLTLIDDRQAMWLVFAHGPDNPSFFYLIIILVVAFGTSWVANNVVSIYDAWQRLRTISKPVRHAYIGIAVLLTPLLFVVPGFTFFKIILTAAATVLHRIVYIGAERKGVSPILLGTASGLFGGILVGLILTDQRQQVYDCKSNTLQLLSGEIMPCKQVVLLGNGPFVIVEGPTKPRLIKTSDFDLDAVDRTSGRSA